MRGLKTSSFVRSKAFSRPSLVIGEFPGAQLLHDRSRDFGLATCTGDYPCGDRRGRTPRVITLTNLIVAVRFAVDMISFSIVGSQLLGLSSRDHTRTLPFYCEIKARTCSFQWDSSGALLRDHVISRLLSMNSSEISRLIQAVMIHTVWNSFFVVFGLRKRRVASISRMCDKRQSQSDSVARHE